jgi:hypothetical protein
MNIIPVTLYRFGSFDSPKMDNVRIYPRNPFDIETYEENNEIWVKAKTGGISTDANEAKMIAKLKRGNYLWRLLQGSIYPDELILNNDVGTHWCWEPLENMPLYQYKAALVIVAALFEKVS